MRLAGDLGQLTWCMNIHPTETWAECRAALTGPVAEVKRAMEGRFPAVEGFAVGLRFSVNALEELADAEARAELAAIIADHDYRPITVNGFPYGAFRGVAVKEEVYQPDWTRPERLAYTNALADLMAELNPEGSFVSLSTVPGTYRPLAEGREAEMAANMLRAVAHLVRLRDRTGVTLALAIEPEPWCFLETTAEAIAFFEQYLFSVDAVATLANLTGLSRNDAAEALPHHLGLCYDVCHAAVEFEDAAASIQGLRRAGIPIHKLQLSSALRVPAMNEAAHARLADFDEPTYLHQVVSRSGDGLRRERDLAPALAREGSEGEEWRVHFHLPLFVDKVPPFATTQDFLREILTRHRNEPISPHLEVETYTWAVLPKELRGENIAEDIARELDWVIDQLS